MRPANPGAAEPGTPARRWLRWMVGGVLLATLPLLALNFVYLVGAGKGGQTVRGRWDLVALNVAFFTLFLVLLPYRRKISWRSKGVAAAFFAALFAEMYGLPLTAYLLAPALGGVPSAAADAPGQGQVFGFTLLAQSFVVTWTMLVGLLLTGLGMTLVALGWRAIHLSHRATGKPALVKGGLYRYSRHPQYLGLGLIIYGWLLGWPTLLGVAMIPLLAYTYHRLAKEEEAEALQVWGSEYREYMARVGRFL